MHSIQEDMAEFRRQLGNGSIQKAYRALLSYMMGLRTHFKKRYPDFAVSGLYQGYMDMTYFALFPPSLRDCDLKVAIVFNYDAFRFEAWLTGRNRGVQRKHWELFRGSQWPEYRVVTPGSIMGRERSSRGDMARRFLTRRMRRVCPSAISSSMKHQVTCAFGSLMTIRSIRLCSIAFTGQPGGLPIGMTSAASSWNSGMIRLALGWSSIPRHRSIQS